MQRLGSMFTSSILGSPWLTVDVCSKLSKRCCDSDQLSGFDERKRLDRNKFDKSVCGYAWEWNTTKSKALSIELAMLKTLCFERIKRYSGANSATLRFLLNMESQ
jgi:hypothetical protein